MKIRNIGIFAHVDAGKTTLSEQLLKHCGAIRQAGSVDRGTAHTDTMEVERRRGISVCTACVPMTRNGVRINLLDTPGHTDFTAEIERSMWALDAAVLVISAAEGVQPQTELLFRALSKKPMILFINKTDRIGADVPRVLGDLRRTLSDRIVDADDDDQIMSVLAEEDEELLEEYLSGSVRPHGELLTKLMKAAREGKAFPAVSGSALKDIGVERLLDLIIDALPAPEGDPSAEPSGIVFRIVQDRSMGRGAVVRLFHGTLRPRMQLKDHKVTGLRDLAAEGRAADLNELKAGEIGVVYGLGEVRTGDVIGDRSCLTFDPEGGKLRQPLLQARAVAEEPDKAEALRTALYELNAEDPLLQVEEVRRVPHVRVMGTIQLEILREQLETRFGIRMHFSDPDVIYRETAAKSAEGFFAYVAPKPCWAIIRFRIDPLPRGSGVIFENTVPDRELLPRYRHQVEQAIPTATRQGILGWQVDDVKITLIEGNWHQFHTHPLDFIVATPVAFLDGLKRCGQVLLEPVLEMHLTVPEETAPKILGEILAMRGETLDSEPVGSMIRLICEVPAATSVEFPQRLAAITGGRGAMTAFLKGYRDCPMDPPATNERRGVDPLDTAKYILAARSALEGEIYE